MIRSEFSVGKDRHSCRFALKRLGCRRVLRQPNGSRINGALGMDRSYSDGTVRRRVRLDGRVRLDASIGRLSWRPLSFAARADASCLAIKASNDLTSREGNAAALRPRLEPQAPGGKSGRPDAILTTAPRGLMFPGPCRWLFPLWLRPWRRTGQLDLE